ncbi:MAG: DUF4175 family protein, partial [Verrucomicrobiaceae bacterium]
MSPSLRSVTVEALASFRERRTKMLWWRAGCAASGLLLGLFLIVALLDRAFFLPDAVRHFLSCASYVSALIVAWAVSLRFIREAQDALGAAKLMETADPALRERLLSAVELAKPDYDHSEDSPEFRAHLQDTVAGQLGGFEVKKLLPTRLIQRTIAALVGVAVLVTGLSFIKTLHLPGFMLRAALPFVNLARPSSTIIKIVTPSNPDTVAPMASSVPFVVEISGTTSKRVVIETQSEDTRPLKIELLAASASRFEGAVNVGQASVRYRVFAGDAITEWHKLDARPRPRVIEFIKTIVPPAYAGLPEKKVTEDHGDITALDGSTVKLEMKTNQPIDRAVATILPSISTLPVSMDKPGWIATSITLDGKTDSWQLALTAKETGFTNDENTPWRIETVADVPPTVAITLPKEQVEVRGDDSVPVAGEAADDIGLAKVELSFAINGADWKQILLKEKAGMETNVSTSFKLAPLPVKMGDAVLVKLVATDLKGQRAESPP